MNRTLEARGARERRAEWGFAVDGDKAYFAVSDLLTPEPGGLGQSVREPAYLSVVLSRKSSCTLEFVRCLGAFSSNVAAPDGR